MADSATMATHSGDTLYLIYHNVPKEDVAYTYAVSAELLRQHLAVVREGHANPHLNASITFDDGHRTQFENALPVLTAAGVKATFFVTAGWTDQEKDSMTAQQLRQLSDAGHTIGAHGLTHRLLTQCSAEELKAELAGAKTRLEQAIGKQVTSLSMPGGRYNRRVLEACAEQGYRSVFTSDPVTEIEDWQGLQVIGRFNVRNTMSAEWLKALLDPKSGVLRKEQRLAQVKGLAQRTLGDNLYHKLWSVLSRESSET